MIRSIVLLVISLLPGFLLARYLYNKDKEKEPMGLLIKLFCGGIIACLMVLIVSSILEILSISGGDTNEMSLTELAFEAFICIAFVEEFCKWIIVYKYSYNHVEFDEFYDMIIYSAFVSLGFACFENIFYVYEGGISTGIIRGVLAVPGHACDAIFMGYYLGLSKICDIEKNKIGKTRNIILSILIPMLLHGAYDYFLMSNSLLMFIAFVIFIILLYIFSIIKVKHVVSSDKKIVNNDYHCHDCGNLVAGNYCTNCGKKKE